MCFQSGVTVLIGNPPKSFVLLIKDEQSRNPLGHALLSDKHLLQTWQDTVTLFSSFDQEALCQYPGISETCLGTFTCAQLTKLLFMIFFASEGRKW